MTVDFDLVVDFRRLNKHVITDPHPLPRIAQIMETLGKAQILSALDLLHGFYNLEVHPEDRRKTAFSTFDGHWEFLRLPMGLKNSPSIFQRLMQIVMSGCLGHHAFIYIDDILVFSKTPEEHLKHLEDVLSRLSAAGLKVKASKCQLFRTEVEYLGFLIGMHGLKVNPRQHEPISGFKRPEAVVHVQKFLGLIGYFRIFVSNFAARARPLYQLLKQDVEWKWGPEQEAAFQDLKKCLLSAPILAHPDWDKEFILVTDASGYGISAVLTQIQDGKERLINCASRVLTKSERNYSNTDREYLAVVYGVNQFRSHLWGNKFKIYTDNSAVSAIARQDKSTSARAVRWYNILHEYDFTIEHRPATTMKHVDTLSRCLPESEMKKLVSVHNFEFSSQVPSQMLNYLSPSWQQGESFVPIFELERWETAMQKDKFPPSFSAESKYELIIEDSLAYRQVKGEPENRQLWVPPSLRKHVMQLFHDPPSVGHIGTRKMIATMTPMVWWSGMTSDVQEYCKTCHMCQQYKNHAARVPTSSKPIPAKCLEDVSLDLIGPVPSAWRGMRYVLCIQDRLSRFLVFAPMASGHAETVARTFLTSWVCQYGAPKRIVTDRGKNLVGAVFKKLCEFLGARHSPTCTYRPQGNAQNERAHKELHQYIAMYLSEASNAANWDLLLNHAAWVHNSSYHTVLKRSPLEVLTGVKPRNGAHFLPGNHPNRQDRDMTFEEYYSMKSEQLEQLQEEARLAIAKAQAVTRANLNKNARTPDFKPGDEVWVKTHGVKTIDKKWDKRYEGPWIVREVISPQVLKLALKEDPSKLDIIHTTYIRKKYDRVDVPEVSDIDDSDPESDYVDYSDDDSDSGNHASNSPQRSTGDPKVIFRGQPSAKAPGHSSSAKPSTNRPSDWWPDALKRIVKRLSPTKSPKKDVVPSASVPTTPPFPSASQTIPSNAQDNSVVRTSDRLALKAQEKAAQAAAQAEKEAQAKAAQAAARAAKAAAQIAARAAKAQQKLDAQAKKAEAQAKKAESKNAASTKTKPPPSEVEKASTKAQTATAQPTQPSTGSRFQKKPQAPPTPGKNLASSSTAASSSSSTSQASQSTSLIPNPPSSTTTSVNRRLDMSLPRFQLLDERTSTDPSSTSSVAHPPEPAGAQITAPAADDGAPDIMPD